MKACLFLLLSIKAIAQTGAWTGTLIDADCHLQQPSAACPAGAATQHFAILVPGGAVFPIAAASAPKMKSLVQEHKGELRVVVGGQLVKGAVAADTVHVIATGAEQQAPAAEGPKPAPSARAEPARRCDIQLENVCYKLSVPKSTRVRRITPRHRGAPHITIDGTIEGGTIRADSVTIR